MTRIQFWIFNVCCLIVTGIIATDIYYTELLKEHARTVVKLEHSIAQSQHWFRTNQLIANRIYQLSGDDDALKQLMVRQNIIVHLPSPTPTPTPSLTPTPVPTPVTTPTKTPSHSGKTSSRHPNPSH